MATPSINLWIGMGEVTRAPRINFTGAGKAFASITVKTAETGRDGREFAAYHTIKAWGEMAERLADTIKQGDTVMVKGEVTYYGVEHAGKKFYEAQIRPREVTVMIAAGGAAPASEPGGLALDNKEDEDDIPFAVPLLGLFDPRRMKAVL